MNRNKQKTTKGKKIKQFIEQTSVNNSRILVYSFIHSVIHSFGWDQLKTTERTELNCILVVDLMTPQHTTMKKH